MKTIVISPWSRKLRNGVTRNPKDYPYWKELVKELKKTYKVIQVGVKGEELIGADEVKFDLSLEELRKLIKNCATWISVDNFFQHLAWSIGKVGIVLFGQSDPNIFGHKENTNMLVGREQLRKFQFDIWERADYKEEAFVLPEAVLKEI